MNVLMITTEWPTSEKPAAVPFIVRQVEYLRCAGIEVDVFHFHGKRNPLRYLKAWFELRARLLSGSFDLIHAQWGQSALLALPKRLPVVITYRGSDLEGVLNQKGKQTLAGATLRLASRLMAFFADQIIVVSRNLADQLPVSTCEIIPSGLELEHFRPMDKTEARNVLGLPQDHKIILFVGDPGKSDKGYDLATSATELIKANHRNVNLLLAHGKPYKQMPLYFNASDVLLLASAHEGSPNIVKEALACNLPVVSTDVGDVRERIGSIDGCVVCRDRRPETLASGLEQVLNQERRIDGRFSVLDLDERLLTQKVIEVYRKALERRKKRNS